MALLPPEITLLYSVLVSFLLLAPACFLPTAHLTEATSGGSPDPEAETSSHEYLSIY